MAVNFFRVGGTASDTQATLFTLHAKLGTSLDVCTFRKGGSSSGYQVTTGKTLWITRVNVLAGDNTGVFQTVALGYADNDVGYDTTTARTNPVDVLGRPEQTTTAAMGGIGYNPSILLSVQNALYAFNEVNIQAAASQKFLYCACVGSTTMTGIFVTCYEV